LKAEQPESLAGLPPLEALQGAFALLPVAA